MLAEGSRTPQHELIVECLDYYGLYGTAELTEKQAKDFCKMKGVQDVSKPQYLKAADEAGV